MVLTRSKARAAAAAAAASAETVKNDEENKLTSSEEPDKLESNLDQSSTTSVNSASVPNPASTSTSSISASVPNPDPDLPPVPSPTEQQQPQQEPLPIPPEPSLEATDETSDSPQVDGVVNEDSPKMSDEEHYYFKRDTRPSKIFKQSEAATYTFVTHTHSRDIEVEAARFRKTFKRFIDKLFEDSSPFNRGCKLHTSALVTYLVVKEGEIVDSPSFYINTRARVLLQGDDDRDETIDDILTSILEQSMDIIDRYIH